ncbi:fused MFS/spermidine synthase [bacterium]|nr:fused MFS/spermidine synthase [bacterium]
MAELLVYAFVMVSGLAALSWEVLWQLKASLSLGISAMGTAITLATTMGGMALGSLLTARYWPGSNPLRLYAGLELLIGLSGLALTPGFAWLERVDAQIYQAWPWAAPCLHLLGIALLLGTPATAMGATIPVYGVLARQYSVELSTLYGLNTLGAAVGCLFLALVAIPTLGVQASIYLIVFFNLSVSLTALTLKAPSQSAVEIETTVALSVGAPQLALALLTGWATFCLEVAWFRALRAAFQTTTASFAVMLAAVLIALAVGARLARQRWPVGGTLLASGCAILVVTPVIERFDMLVPRGGNYFALLGIWLACSLAILGPPITLLGTVLPGLLDSYPGLPNWSRLYAFNTLGAVLGSLGAAWLLLPGLGLVHTAWLTGLVVGFSGLSLYPQKRGLALGGLAACLAVAWLGQSGVGTTRVPSRPDFPKRIVSFYEGPDSQVAVVEKTTNNALCLLIDGFVASSQQSNGHYMAWMGRVPMLLHPDPKSALVICFGTGQTINAVRQEGCQWADVVDVNPRVIECAPLFSANQGVLQDPRVHAHVMDGRAWLRRTTRRYDVITLEPMPPRLAGVNALYSEEFYRLASSRLNPGGIVAQWLPFHLQTPYYSVAIAASFEKVFHDSFIWQDPRGDCILVGRVGSTENLGSEWPGLRRTSAGRDMTPQEIVAAAWLRQPALQHYLSLGREAVNDDNQLLAYGGVLRFNSNDFGDNQVWAEWAHNLATIERAEKSGPSAQLALQLATLRAELQARVLQPKSWWPVRNAREELRQKNPTAPLVTVLDRLRLP